MEFTNFKRCKRLLNILAGLQINTAKDILQEYEEKKLEEGEFAAARYLILIYQDIAKNCENKPKLLERLGTI